MTLGWNLGHTAQDELFAAIESTAMHTRIILERMMEHGVPVRRLIHAGGIPQHNETLNQVYANVMGAPVLVPERSITSLGAAIFALVAAGAYDSIDAAQRALCPPYRIVAPDPEAHQRYNALYALFSQLYFGLGQRDADPVRVGNVLPDLISLARQ